MVISKLHLKDNQPKDTSQVDQITEDHKRVLRFLSTHSLQSIKDDKGCNVLVFPQSFTETADDIKEAFVLNYVEDVNGNPIFIDTGNLVGFIGYNGVEISIHSRFSTGEGETIQDYFLFYMLEKTLSINLFNLPTSASSVSVFDFLLFFFPKMLKEALSQGLYKKYVYHENNDANVRGVVDFNRHIRHNIPNNGRVAYRTREFSYDNPVTQLIRHTIECIRRDPFGQAVLNNDTITKTCVQQIIQATPSFVPRQQQSVINDNVRPIVHPYYTKYAALQKLCLSILHHEKLSYDSTHSIDKIHGILIDAAWLWEEYVARILAEKGSKLQHFTLKNSSFYLFDKGGNPFQRIVPDYYDKDDKVIADAKYMPLDLKDRLTGDSVESVYYKTIMYMYRFNSEKGFLFHPVKPSETHSGKVTSTKFNIHNTKGSLHKVGMVIPLVMNYSEFKDYMLSTVNAFYDVILNDSLNSNP